MSLLQEMNVDPNMNTHQAKPHFVDADAFRSASTLGEQLRVINQTSFLHDGECEVLYGLAEEAVGTTGVNLPFVEVGSRFGCSTMTLALAARNLGAGPVVGIDPHQWNPQELQGIDSLSVLHQNLSSTGLIDLVIPVLALSQDALPLIPDVSLIFIDGDHSYEAVCSDLRSIPERIYRGDAVICGHDYAAGVMQVVDEFANEMGWGVSSEIYIWRLLK